MYQFHGEEVAVIVSSSGFVKGCNVGVLESCEDLYFTLKELYAMLVCEHAATYDF